MPQPVSGGRCALTIHECPLCKVRMDLEYYYEFRYFWCDDCKERVRRYWRPR